MVIILILLLVGVVLGLHYTKKMPQSAYELKDRLMSAGRRGDKEAFSKVATRTREEGEDEDTKAPIIKNGGGANGDVKADDKATEATPEKVDPNATVLTTADETETEKEKEDSAEKTEEAGDEEEKKPLKE